MKKIITIQHPQSEQHLNGMIGSWADWDLTALGAEQAHAIGRALHRDFADEKFVLYASDLKRTWHTAEIIGEHLHTEPIFSQFLREFDLGEAVGKSKAWAKQNTRCPLWPHMRDWAATGDGRVFDGAESREEVWRRVSDFYHQIVLPADSSLIIVSHDGTLSLFHALWLGLDLSALDHVYIAGKPGGVSVLLEDEVGNHILSRLNDTSYAREQYVSSEVTHA